MYIDAPSRDDDREGVRNAKRATTTKSNVVCPSKKKKPIQNDAINTTDCDVQTHQSRTNSHDFSSWAYYFT